MILNNPSLLKSDSYVNGQWIPAISGQYFDVKDPATGEIILQCSDSGAKETNSAIDAAQNAFTTWSVQPAKARAKILRVWYDLIISNKDDLAIILTHEQGKPLSEAKGEIEYGASFIEWYAEESKRMYGDIIPGHSIDKRIVVMKQPIGVVGAITPWNFPNAMITRKVAPALASGCTVVVKPSEETPLSALALAYLSVAAGIPPGVFNVVVGQDASEIGKALTESHVVRKISFTGSTPVGKLLMKQSAETVKKISLELGGNAPFIVLDDADIHAAVKGAIASKYRNSGQTCVCANRFFIQEGIYDDFCRQFAEEVSKLKVGNGMDDKITLGPLINMEAVAKVDRIIDDALLKGASIHKGNGHKHKGGDLFYEPVILIHVDDDMACAKEEIFGPVAPIFKFANDQEVIERANNTNAGLAAYFYGRDIKRIWKLAERLEYGMIGVNEGIISTELAPFGGFKQSGIGREGSKYGLDEYIELKYVCLGNMD